MRTLQAAWGARRRRRQELAARLVASSHFQALVLQARASQADEEAEPEAELW